jgi:phosphonate transport system substrate-binding protein
MLAFRQNGLSKSDLASSVFSGNHKASTDKLLNGEVDAIAVYSNDSKGTKGAWTQYHEKDLKVRPLWISESLPTDPFTVRQDFYDTYPGFSHNVMMTLLDIPDTNKNVLKDLLGIQKMSIANSAQYEPIRKLITNLAL